MALQSSGAISLYDIQNEFGGSNPISISEYYGVASGIPSSGTISIGDFYGASAASTGSSTIQVRGDTLNDRDGIATRMGYQAASGGDFHHPEALTSSTWDAAFGSIGDSNIIAGGSITGVTVANYQRTSISASSTYTIIVISTDRTTDGGWTSFTLTAKHPPHYGTVSYTNTRAAANTFALHTRLKNSRGVTRYKWVYILGTSNTNTIPLSHAFTYQTINNGTATISFS